MGGSSRAPTGWWELTVPATPVASEALTNFLWELGAVGVVEEERAGTAARLRAFFPARLAAAALAARVTDYVTQLTVLGFGSGDPPEIAPLEDVAWAEAWREHFRPVPVGRRLVVVPPWDAAAVGGRVAIVIEPGRAFGTGHHGSTAGCLVAVEAAVDDGPITRMLDLGTGSGVLAIAAARLGIANVLAVDEDPDAIASAVANAARNRVSDRVRCVIADVGTLVADPAPLVVANLLAAAHHRLAERYRALVGDDGILILGGILDGEATEVATAVAGAGFAPQRRLTVDGWTTVILRRVPRGSGDAALHRHA